MNPINIIKTAHNIYSNIKTVYNIGTIAVKFSGNNNVSIIDQLKNCYTNLIEHEYKKTWIKKSKIRNINTLQYLVNTGYKDAKGSISKQSQKELLYQAKRSRLQARQFDQLFNLINTSDDLQKLLNSLLEQYHKKNELENKVNNIKDVTDDLIKNINNLRDFDNEINLQEQSLILKMQQHIPNLQVGFKEFFSMFIPGGSSDKYSIKDFIQMYSFKQNLNNKEFQTDAHKDFRKYIFSSSSGILGAKQFIENKYGKLISDLMYNSSIGDINSSYEVSRYLLETVYFLLNNNQFNMHELCIIDEINSNIEAQSFATMGEAYTNSFRIKEDCTEIVDNIYQYYQDIGKSFNLLPFTDLTLLKWNLIGGNHYLNGYKKGLLYHINSRIKNFKIPTNDKYIYSVHNGFQSSKFKNNFIKAIKNNNIQQKNIIQNNNGNSFLKLQKHKLIDIFSKNDNLGQLLKKFNKLVGIKLEEISKKIEANQLFKDLNDILKDTTMLSYIVQYYNDKLNKNKPNQMHVLSDLNTLLKTKDNVIKYTNEYVDYLFMQRFELGNKLSNDSITDEELRIYVIIKNFFSIISTDKVKKIEVSEIVKELSVYNGVVKETTEKISYLNVFIKNRIINQLELQFLFIKKCISILGKSEELKQFIEVIDKDIDSLKLIDSLNIENKSEELFKLFNSIILYGTITNNHTINLDSLNNLDTTIINIKNLIEELDSETDLSKVPLFYKPLLAERNNDSFINKIWGYFYNNKIEIDNKYKNQDIESLFNILEQLYIKKINMLRDINQEQLEINKSYQVIWEVINKLHQFSAQIEDNQINHELVIKEFKFNLQKLDNIQIQEQFKTLTFQSQNIYNVDQIIKYFSNKKEVKDGLITYYISIDIIEKLINTFNTCYATVNGKIDNDQQFFKDKQNLEILANKIIDLQDIPNKIQFFDIKSYDENLINKNISDINDQFVESSFNNIQDINNQDKMRINLWQYNKLQKQFAYFYLTNYYNLDQFYKIFNDSIDKIVIINQSDNQKSTIRINKNKFSMIKKSCDEIFSKFNNINNKNLDIGLGQESLLDKDFVHYTYKEHSWLVKVYDIITILEKIKTQDAPRIRELMYIELIFDYILFNKPKDITDIQIIELKIKLQKYINSQDGVFDPTLNTELIQNLLLLKNLYNRSSPYNSIFIIIWTKIELLFKRENISDILENLSNIVEDIIKNASNMLQGYQSQINVQDLKDEFASNYKELHDSIKYKINLENSNLFFDYDDNKLAGLRRFIWVHPYIKNYLEANYAPMYHVDLITNLIQFSSSQKIFNDIKNDSIKGYIEKYNDIGDKYGTLYANYLFSNNQFICDRLINILEIKSNILGNSLLSSQVNNNLQENKQDHNVDSKFADEEDYDIIIEYNKELRKFMLEYKNNNIEYFNRLSNKLDYLKYIV